MSEHAAARPAAAAHGLPKDTLEPLLTNKLHEGRRSSTRRVSSKKQTGLHAIQSLWYASVRSCVLFASSGFCFSVQLLMPAELSLC